jgi:hypothetical protein
LTIFFKVIKNYTSLEYTREIQATAIFLIFLGYCRQKQNARVSEVNRCLLFITDIGSCRNLKLERCSFALSKLVNLLWQKNYEGHGLQNVITIQMTLTHMGYMTKPMTLDNWVLTTFYPT